MWTSASAEPAVAQRPTRHRSDWVVVGLVFAVGLVETLSPGLGWPVFRGLLAVVFAVALFRRREHPVEVLVGLAAMNLAADIALTLAGHSILFVGVTLVFAFDAMARWADGRMLLIGLGVIAAHAVALLAVDPNASAPGVIILHAGPVLFATVTGPHIPQLADRPAVRRLSGTAVIVALVWLFSVAQGTFLTDELAGYVTRVRAPDMTPDQMVDDAMLRLAAEASRGTHGPDGAVRHTVDYPDQLLTALESPTASIEADVSVVDGTTVLQHDPRYAVGMDLTDLLEYATIADIPTVKLDLKRDHVQVVIDTVEDAVDRFGLDPSRLQFNADVFRGPGVDEDRFGARADKSFTDRIYNLLVMELEMSDLVVVAEHFPESTIMISAFTPTGPLDEGYSPEHLDQFVDAAEEIRETSPGQHLAFAVRGDLAAMSADGFLEGLTAIEDSFVAAWWSSDPRPNDDEIEALRAAGVTHFDLGEEARF